RQAPPDARRSRSEGERSSSEDALEAVLGLLFRLLALGFEPLAGFALQPRLLLGGALLGLLPGLLLGLVHASAHRVLELLGALLAEEALCRRSCREPQQRLCRGADVEPL